MEIHFYESQVDMPADVNGYYGWEETYDAITGGVDKICTTQMGLLSTRLCEQGYRIFVHAHNDYYEIKLGNENARTNREIRVAHNLFKMWQSGEFVK